MPCKGHVCVLSLSGLLDSVTPWTASRQAPLSMGILQARVLEWVSISFSRGSSWPRDRTHIFYIGRCILYRWAIWESHTMARVQCKVQQLQRIVCSFLKERFVLYLKFYLFFTSFIKMCSKWVKNLSLFIKMCLKWVTDLNLRCKTMKLLQDNVRENLGDPGFGNKVFCWHFLLYF